MLRTVFLLGFLITVANSSKILCYFANPGRSHVLLALPICEELSRRGHQVTAVTNHKHGLGSVNYTEIVVPLREWEGELKQQMSSGKMGFSLGSLLEVIRQFTERNIETIESKEVQKILKEGSFDLVFFVNAFTNNYNLGIADHFKAPWAALTPMGPIYATRELMGSHSFLSTVPSKILGYSSQMTFYQRLINFGMALIELAMTKYLEIREAELYNKLWPSDKYRSFTEMKYNGSAMFYNGHWSESKIIRPTLPNEVEIGGIQINTNPKPLEADVQKFLDEAKDGVIIWTFGSNIPVSNVDPEKLEIMFKVLGKLKQRVILRWDSDDVSQLPANCMGRRWLAQDSILAHKNVILFITHGGHGGTMEAMYHQVPVLGFPFFGDQDTNMAKTAEDGWGRSMKIYDVTEENFSEALHDVLTNKKYREVVKKLSDTYKDRPEKPLESAIFWMEYILKYNGAPHLNYPGRHLNFFQLYSIDVIAFIAVVLFLVFYTIFAIFRLIFRKLCGFGKVTQKGKSKDKSNKKRQ